MVILMDPLEDPDDILRANRSREKTYMLDVAFDYLASQVSPEQSPAPPIRGSTMVLSAGGGVQSYDQRADRGPHIGLQRHGLRLRTHRWD